MLIDSELLKAEIKEAYKIRLVLTEKMIQNVIEKVEGLTKLSNEDDLK